MIQNKIDEKKYVNPKVLTNITNFILENRWKNYFKRIKEFKHVQAKI